MVDVFLSYSSKDRAAAERVQQALKARGLDVFLDQETPAGMDWDTWIRAKLADCKVVLVLWSRTSVKSPNVRHEAIIARDANKLMPAMTDILEPEDFPMGLYMVQAANLHDWRDAGSKGMARLVADIETRLRGAPPPLPAARAEAPRFGAPGRTSPAMIATSGVLAIGIIAGAWWLLKQKPAASASAAPAATISSAFSTRLIGYWRWSETQPCAAGSNITLEGGRLIMRTPEIRSVHMIDSDTSLETRTTVLEPDFVFAERYVFTPEFFAQDEVRGFKLIVNETTKPRKYVWTPCEP